MVLILQSEGNGNGLAKFSVPNSVARLNYFFGQLLSQRDLQAEQTYNLVLRRLVQRETFGTGTVAGLEVSKEKGGETLPLGVFIAPGFAVDPDGRELLLEKDVAIDVADPPLQPEDNPFPGVLSLAEEIAERWEHPFDVVDLAELGTALLGCGLISEITDAAIQDQLEKLPVDVPDISPPTLLRDWLFDQLIGVTFIGLRYRETSAEMAPAVLDASCCGDTTCRPSRTQEGVFIVTSRERFPEIVDPYEQFKLCLDEDIFNQIDTDPDGVPEQIDCKSALCRCVLASWRALPRFNDACGASEPPIVCLAQVCWDRYSNGGNTQILNIDNCECRPLAPGGPALRAFIESLTGCATPQFLAPRLVEIDPEEAKEFEAADTNGSITLTATANADVKPEPFSAEKVWEIRYYAESGTTVEVFDGNEGPQGRDVTVTFNGHDIQITLDAADPVAPLPPGTYVWRLTNEDSEDSTIFETQTDQELDGEPNPPKDVPSGDGIAGGGFEARFVVKNGGGE
jgi:hypothetical protein